MHTMLAWSARIDRVLSIAGHIGAWCGMLLVFAVCIDVATRYLGLPKPFGWNATQLQESEYWLHTFLFALMIGWAYVRQAHVRIDLFRELTTTRTKCLFEMAGIVLFLATYSVFGVWYCYEYALASYLSGEASKATVGLTHIWIVKSALVVMFVLMGLAAVSQFIKVLAVFRGELSADMTAAALGS